MMRTTGSSRLATGAQVRYFEWPDLERGADPTETTSTLMVFAAGPLGGPGEETFHATVCTPVGLSALAGGTARTELRLSRLDNDSSALYELITGISSTQQEHSRRFDAMDRRFDSVEATLGEVVRRLPEPA